LYSSRLETTGKPYLFFGTVWALTVEKINNKEKNIRKEKRTDVILLKNLNS